MAKRTPRTLEEQDEWLKKAKAETAEQQAARLKAKDKRRGRGGRR